MFKKIKAIIAITHSDGFAVATSKEAMMAFPTVELDNMNNIILLSAQRSALESFRDNIDNVISEHDEAVQLLERRQKGKRDNSNTTAKRKASKTEQNSKAKAKQSK